MFKVLFRPLPMIALAAGLLLWGGSVFMKTPPRAVAADPAPHVPRPAAATSAKPSSAIRVEAVTPKQGGLPRITVQPGSVHSFETAFLYAKVSGYLKEQTVDIGDTVKKGQLLAVIDAPELEKEVDRCQAELDRAKAEVKQAEAAVTTARSQVDAAQAEQAEAQAAIQRDAAYLSFREKQYNRMRELFQLKSIDERLVDEKEDQFLAAQSDLEKSNATVATAKAKVAARQAELEQAQSDVTAAKSRAKVAEAVLQKAKVFVNYTRIMSPFDGVITDRKFFVGDFIKSADEGAHIPLLRVSRTDRMRVVVQVPDRDVPLTDPGDAAVMEVDALPGSRFVGKVSRHANSEDHETRTMRTEIDLENKDNRLRDGMYGQVTITLDSTDAGLTLPSACLNGPTQNGQGAVYVVEGDKAKLTPVTIGQDNGVYVAVLSGLKPDQKVVFRYNGVLSNDSPVTVTRTYSVEDAVSVANQ